MNLLMRRRAMMAGLKMLKTVTGAIATFVTNWKLPLHTVTIPFTHVQAAGTPSPDSPLPISGWTGANIKCTGENVCGGLALAEAFEGVIGYSVNEQNKTFTFTRGGSPAPEIFKGMKWKENTQYSFVFTHTGDRNTCIHVYYTDGGERNPDLGTTTEKQTFIATTVAGKTISRVTLGWNVTGQKTIYYDESGVFEGVITADEYETYHGQTLPINWQSSAGTIYGGSITLNEDGSVDVVADHKSYTWSSGFAPSSSSTEDKHLFVASRPSDFAQTSAENWDKKYYSNILSLASRGTTSTNMVDGGIYAGSSYLTVRIDSVANTQDAINALLTATPLQIVAPLVTPQPYHFDNIGQLIAFKGENNVWSDLNGDVTVQYWR